MPIGAQLNVQCMMHVEEGQVEGQFAFIYLHPGSSAAGVQKKCLRKTQFSIDLFK